MRPDENQLYDQISVQYTTHSWPNTEITIGIIRFPALVYIIEALSTLLNEKIFPKTFVITLNYHRLKPVG